MKRLASLYLLLSVILLFVNAIDAQYFYNNGSLFQVGHRENVNDVKWSPDNTKILSYSSPENFLRVWDVKEGRKLWSAHTGFIQDNYEAHGLLAFDWSSDGRLIASASSNGKIQMWDAANGKLLWMVKGHKESGQVVKFSPDNRYILSIAEEAEPFGQLKLWSVADGRLVRILDGKANNPVTAAFSADGRSVKVGYYGGGVYVWDVTSGRRTYVRTFKPCGNLQHWLVSSAFSPDLSLFAGRCGDKTVITQTSDSKILRILLMREDFTKGIGFSGDGKLLLVTDLDGYLTFNIQTRSVGKIATSINSGFTFEPNYDGSLLAEGGGFRAEGIRISDISTGRASVQLESHPGIIFALAYSSDGGRFASGSSDRVLRVWDAHTKEILLSLRGHSKGIKSVEFSPDGKRITSASEKEEIIWDAITGKKIAETKRETELSNELKESVVSPNGKYLLRDLGDEKPFTLFDASTGDVIREFGGLTQIQGFKFTPDEKRFISAAYFHPLQMWDIESGNRLRDFEVGYSYDNVVAFSPDGRSFITGGGNQNILMYNLDTGALIWSLFPIDKVEAVAESQQEARRVKQLRDEADAREKADSLTATFRKKVYITFEHYGDATDIGELMNVESGIPNNSKIKKTPESANAVWLRLHNDSPLPVEIPTQSMYLPNPKCFFKFSNEAKTLGLCEGQEISVWHGLENEEGKRIPYGFDFGSSAILLPNSSVVFAVPLNVLRNGNAVVFDFKFQNAADDGKIVEYGNEITLKFRNSDLPSK